MSFGYSLYVMAPVALETLLRRAFPGEPVWMSNLRRDGDSRVEWEFVPNTAFWGVAKSVDNLYVDECVGSQRWVWEGPGAIMLFLPSSDLDTAEQRATVLRTVAMVLESGREDLAFSAEDHLLLRRVDGVIQRFEKDDFWDWVKPDDVPPIMRDTVAFPSPKRSPVAQDGAVADVDPEE